MRGTPGGWSANSTTTAWSPVRRPDKKNCRHPRQAARDRCEDRGDNVVMSSRTVLCQVIEGLFQRSPDVRQAWIVVEWLERNAQDELGEFYEQVHHTASHGKGSSRQC